MARMTFKAGEEYELKLSKLAAGSEGIAKKALYAAGEIVANEVRKNLEALPEEKYRRLKDGESFDGLSAGQKQDLSESFGVTKIKLSKDGFWNVKIGFDGYGRFPTKKYPNGLPNQLLARAVESGSSVRQKHPFVRPAVNATKKAAVEAMQKVIDEEIEKTMKG